MLFQVISLGLAYHYQVIFCRIEFYRERAVPDEVWFDIRSQYTEVSELVKLVNETMDKLLIVACQNDAYFIIVQLLNLTT